MECLAGGYGKMVAVVLRVVDEEGEGSEEEGEEFGEEEEGGD